MRRFLKRRSANMSGRWSLSTFGFPLDVFSSATYETKSGLKALCTLESVEQPQVILSSVWDASYLYVNYDKNVWTVSAGRWKESLDKLQNRLSEETIIKIFELGKDMIIKTVNKIFLYDSKGQISNLDQEGSTSIKQAFLLGEKTFFLYDNGSLCRGPLNSPLSDSHLSLGWAVERVSCGSDHILMLEEGAGRVWSMGLNLRGQLGHGDVVKRLEPCVVEALDGMKVVAISSGYWHNLVLSEFGDLYSWGWNAHKQLGHSYDVNTVAIPCLVPVGDLEFTNVGCGSRHSAALSNCGKLMTWGWNGYHQLGLGKKANDTAGLCSEGLTVSWMGCGPWNTFLLFTSN